MNRILTIVLIAAAVGLSACTATGIYPLSNEQCGPTDPVKDLDAADCTIPGA